MCTTFEFLIYDETGGSRRYRRLNVTLTKGAVARLVTGDRLDTPCVLKTPRLGRSVWRLW